MRDRSNISEQAEPGLKKLALEYYQANSEVYAERYSVDANGDVIWTRHRAILQMVHEMRLPRESRVLDLGCGPGILSFDLARLGYRGVGMDATPAMIERCKLKAAAMGIAERWQYQGGDAEALPFEDQSFDLVVCSGVIEYLPSDERTLREVARVLRPGGRFVLSVTNKYGYTVSLLSIMQRIKRVPGAVKAASFVRRTLVGGEHGVMHFNFLPRKHRPSVVRKALTQHGFQIEKDQYVQFTLFPSPLCALTSMLTRRIDEKLELLDRTPLRIFGSCYLMSTRKAGQPAEVVVPLA